MRLKQPKALALTGWRFFAFGAMRDIKAIIPKTVAVVDGEERRVSVIDLMDLIDEISEAAEARRGDKGERGEHGPAGADGKDGKDGRDGIDGKPGPAGKDGLNGRDGADGRNGRDGVNGLNGLPPEHEIDTARPAVRFKNPDGTWGAWIVPPAGKSGRSGGGSSWAGSAEFDAKVREIAADVSGGGSAATPRVYVQSASPSVTAGTPYIWVQTGMGGGSDFTLWFDQNA